MAEIEEIILSEVKRNRFLSGSNNFDLADEKKWFSKAGGENVFDVRVPADKRWKCKVWLEIQEFDA